MSYDPTTLVPPMPPRAAENGVEPGFSRLEPLITPKELRRQFLFGIPLKSALTKQELQDEDLQAIITRAVSRIEHEAKIWISPVKFQEEHDYVAADWTQWSFIQLNNAPILQVESFKAIYPFTEQAVEYPTDWLAIKSETGIIQLVPKNGSLSQVMYTQGGNFLPMIMGTKDRLPSLFRVTYTSGFENDKIPALINELVGTYATLDVLTMVDSVLFLGSYSLNIDGVGQSVGLPGPGWLAGRIAALTDKAEKIRRTIMAFYNRSILISSI